MDQKPDGEEFRADVPISPSRSRRARPATPAREPTLATTGRELASSEIAPSQSPTLELREEQLVPHRELRDLGEIVVRTEVETGPARLEAEALREEVEIEHVPVGETVTEKRSPWEENGVLVVPVYEEQLVVTKRLVLREHLRIRRVGVTETYQLEDTVRRERLVVEDPNQTGLVRQVFPDQSDRPEDSQAARGNESLLGRVLRRTEQ